LNIIWQYLDKRNGAISALKDYKSMQYILEHTDEEIAQASDAMISLGSPGMSDLPKGGSNPHAGENRLIAAIDEIDVLKERYRQAVEYMDWFQPAWMAMSEEDRHILSEFYWVEEERQTDALYNLCDHYGIERTSVYKRKNRAINKLALLLFGK